MLRKPIRLKHQTVIWWAGLMRGAVSIALAFKQFTYSGVTWNPVYATMITGIVIVVLFTTLPPKVITVVLKVRMHCEACAQVLQKRISKMDGVKSAAADMKNDEVIVKGIVDPTQLVEKVNIGPLNTVEYVYPPEIFSDENPHACSLMRPWLNY